MTERDLRESLWFFRRRFTERVALEMIRSGDDGPDRVKAIAFLVAAELCRQIAEAEATELAAHDKDRF